MNNKKQALALLIVSIFLIGSVVGFTGSSFSPETIPDIPNLPEQKELPNIALEPEQTKSVPEGWNLGESVTVDYSFSTKAAKDLIGTYPNEYLASTTITGDISRTYESDNIYQSIICTTSTDCDIPYPDYNSLDYMVSLEYVVDVKVNGEMHIEAKMTYVTNKGTGSVGVDYDRSVSITKEHISTGGEIKVKVAAYGGPNLDIGLVYYVFNYENGNYDQYNAYYNNDATAACIFTSLELEVDRIYFVPTAISSEIRSNYQYASESVITHRLVIENFDYGTELTINKPSEWTYSSINPDCTVTEGTDTVLTNTIPLNYEVFFTSNSTYFLAIEETTDRYLTDIGFENAQWQNDFDDYSSSYLTPTIETGIVFDGYHSLKLTKISGGEVLLKHTETDIFSEGDYYFSCAYYVDSWTDSGSDLKFYYGKSSNVEIIASQSTVEMDRWHIYQTYFSLTDDSFAFDFYIDASSSTATIYIDNIQIFKVSTEISTTNLSEYLIKSTFISWDGYQNPTVSSESVTFDLLERSSQTLIESYTTTTNNVGLATWQYENSLVQKEYQINCFANNSFWSPTPYTGDIYNIASWSCWGGQSVVSESVFSDGQPTETIQTEIDNNAASIVLPKYDPNEDFSQSDIYSLRIKVSEITNLSRIDFVYRQSGSNQIIWRVYDYQLIANEYFQFFFRTYDCTSVHDDFTGSVSEFLPIYNLDSSMDKTINFYFAEMKTLQTQKFYFTPAYAYEIDYAETELSDSWDFSEGDKDNWSPYSYVNYDIVNGYFEKESVTAYSKCYINNIESFDETIYTEISFRVWSNVSQTLHFNQKTGGMLGTTRRETHHTITANTWTVFTTKINQNYDIDCFILNTDSSATAKKIRIDFIRLVHVEEEDTYLGYSYLGIGSENDAWESAVYSDDILLGNYQDPYLVYYNSSYIGTHNITWLPYNRPSAPGPYLYSTSYTYTYEIEDTNVLMIELWTHDVDLTGYITTNIKTNWGNCTTNTAVNGSFLTGSAAPEGANIYSFDPTLTGFYNVSVHLFNGLTEVYIEYFSFTIQEPSILERETSFHFYSTIDGFGLDEDIVKIYISDVLHPNLSRVNPDCYVAGEEFDVQIESYFGEVLFYQVNISYARHFDIGIALVECSFIHNATYYQNEYVPIRVFLSNNYSTLEFTLNSPYETYTIRLLLNSNYTVVCIPEERYSDDNMYEFYPTKTEISVTEDEITKTRSFSVSVAADSISSEPDITFLRWMQLNWWWMTIIISAAGLIIGWYYNRRRTKAVESQTEESTTIYSGPKGTKKYREFRAKQKEEKERRTKYN